jgi:hypothetical protein
VNEVQQVAVALKQELGWATLGQLGEAGLRDAIWDEWPQFQQMTEVDREYFAQAVYHEIYG